jgi:hypothetical protein
MNALFLGACLAFLFLVGLKVLQSMGAGAGLLSSTRGGPPEPERVQAMVGTVAAAAAYATACLGTLKTGRPAMPEPETWMVVVAGGSQFAYLLGKAIRLNN